MEVLENEVTVVNPIQDDVFADEIDVKTFTRHSYRLIQNTFENGMKITDLRDVKEGRNGRPFNQLMRMNFYEKNEDLIRHIVDIEDDPDSYYLRYDFNKMLNVNLMNYALKWHKYYLENWQENLALLTMVNRESGDLHRVRLETRYSKSYQKKVKKRIAWLGYDNKQSNAVMLSLTMDPKRYEYSIPKMWTCIKKELNRFLTNLRREICYEKVYHCYLNDAGVMCRKIKYEKYRDMPKYLDSVEAMKGRAVNNYLMRGAPHIHLVFLGVTRLMDWREIRHLWKNGHVWINRTYDKRKVRKPIDYIGKYITKTFCSDDDRDPGILLTRSLTWLYGTRSYSYSKGLLYPLKGLPSGMYDVLYLLEYAERPDLDRLLKDLNENDHYFLSDCLQFSAG